MLSYEEIQELTKEAELARQYQDELEKSAEQEEE